MANKRDLKKEIRYTCGDIAVACMATADYVQDIDLKKLGEIIEHTANLQINALKNATFSFDKTPGDFDNVKEYHKAANAYYKKAYKAFRDDFGKELQSIVKSMNELFKAQKADEANK